MTTPTQPMPTVKVVSFLGHEIRVSGSADDALFCSKDAHDAAGYSQHRHSYAALPNWAKGGVVRLHALSGRKGGAQAMPMLTEAGLYYLFARSTKPQAQQFIEWICAEVLPSIRRYGLYVSEGVANRAPQPGTLLRTRAMARLAACREALQRDPATRPADTMTIAEFLEARGLSLRKGELMRFSRRAWCAAGQRYDAPRLYLGAQRFPVLYPVSALETATFGLN